MASIKDLRKRIGTVKNTQQMTRAMKMISAAKLRRAQEAIHNQRPYARQIGALFKLVSNMPEVPQISPLIRREAGEGELAGKKKLLLVLVTSDRGLCGGFNGSVVKAAYNFMKEYQKEYETIELGFVGRRGHDHFKSRKAPIAFYAPDLGGKVTFNKARKLSELVIESYLSGRVNEVRFIYNEFKNAVSQKVLVEGYLPLMQTTDVAAKEKESDETSPSFVIKPTPTGVLLDLLNRHFAVQAFRILLESQASEHGARMSAMENATKNAEEMIRKLTLQYNKQRQAAITKELSEIIGGSESQKT